jgi:hypothetical protein
MAPSKSHPHIENPSDAELARLVEDRAAVVQRLYVDVHRLVVETLPDVAFSVDCVDAQIGHGVRQYGYDGWGMAALAPFAKWVSLAFLRGAKLANPGQLLQGSGASVRHVKIHSPNDLLESRIALQHLFRAAAQLHQQ